MSENIFEKAVRLKLRFEYKGFIGVEDLWDLKPEELNKIYSNVKKELRSEEDGLMATRKTKAEKEAQLKLDVLKYVFDVKQAEADEQKVRAENKRKKDYLLGVLERKQNEQIESSSMEDIQRMFNELVED